MTRFSLVALALAACGGGGSDDTVDGARLPDGAAPPDSVAVPGDYPNADNTGIPNGACPSGLREATAEDERPPSGTTFECVRWSTRLPYIDQETTNVTFRYNRFETAVDAFINLQGGPVTIEDSELAGGAGTWIRAAYNADGLTVRRCDFSGMANAIEWGVDGVDFQDNFVHDFGDVDPEQHADGFQGGGASGLIRHNTILLNSVWGGTGAVMLEGTMTVDDNLLAGGGYTIYVKDDLTFTNNHVSTIFSETSGEYGPVYPEALGAGGTWTGNVWHDGPNEGQEIAAPAP